MDGPSMRNRTYFYRLWAQVFRVGWSCYTIIINVSTWFIICLGYLYFVWRFVNTVSRTSKKSWWRRCSSQHVRICDLICSNGLQLYLTIIKLHEERIRHLYDIDIIVQIILTLVPLYRVTIFWPSGRLKKVDPFRTWAFGTHSTALRATCTRYFNNFMAHYL